MTRYNIAIEDSEKNYECDIQDTLLRSALRAGLGFPYECNSGGCGSCKISLVEGTVETLWSEAPGLSRRDIRKGRILACQCRPTSDCIIQVSEQPEAKPSILPQRYTVRYVERRDLTRDMSEFVFKSDKPADFLPGQYALLTLPGIEGDRAYSMSNLPNKMGQWHFIIKKMPEGKGTHWLFDVLQTGDEVTLDGPYGLAYLRKDVPRDIVCIAGGSGLSPVMSITRAALSCPELENHNIMMFYGGRGPEDICTPQLVSDIENNHERLSCYNATSDPVLSERQGWDGECCYVHELVEKVLGDTLKNYEYYFCGPPKMTECVQRMLMIEHQVPFEQIHFDRFF